MSERKKGGLDYTARAFPGARAPDGPASGMEDKLAQLGLIEEAEAQEPRHHARADVKSGARKRRELEYTPQAFPGARAPDGPAPDLEDRLVAMGLAERTETRGARHDARVDTSQAVPQPAARREKPAVAPAPVTPPPAQSDRAAAAAPRAPAPASVPRAVSFSAPRVSTNAPIPPPATSTRSPEPTQRPPLTSQQHVIIGAQPVFTPTPKPGYVAPAAEEIENAAPIERPQQIRTAAPTLPPVPPEAVPRRLPREPVASAPARENRSAARPAARSARAERLNNLPTKEERVRLSVRLVTSVDDKLNDLAHLRGLDRNTAVSVAIAQDWVGCFGLQSKQGARSSS